jgi:hypothetical protein
MSIKCKINQAMAMDKLLFELFKMKLPIFLGFQLTNLSRVITPAVVGFTESRNALIRQFGKPVDGADNFEVSPENMEVYREEFNKLAGVELSFEVLPLKIKDFSMVELPPVVLIACEPFFDLNGKAETPET